MSSYRSSPRLSGDFEYRANAHSLLTAAGRNDIPTIRRLVDNGLHVDSQFDGASTALVEAVVMGHMEAVEFLLQNGANVNKPDIDGITPLCAACMERTLWPIAMFLLENGADASLKTDDGTSTLNFVLHSEDGENSDETNALICLLFEKGVDVASYEPSCLSTPCRGFSPLTQTVKRNVFFLSTFHLIANELTRKNLLIPSLDFVHPRHGTPLHVAIVAGNKKAVERLLAAGSDVRIRDGFGRDAMQCADFCANTFHGGNMTIVQLLSTVERKIQERTIEMVAAMGAHERSVGSSIQRLPPGMLTELLGYSQHQLEKLSEADRLICNIVTMQLKRRSNNW